jgi:DNA-binding transcriptional LysR family regulator
MTFGQLQIFATVAEAKGFTGAAQRLGISQSAVSHAIKSLEKELNAVLILRSSVQVELTELGARLLSRAREMLSLQELMRQEAADFRGVHLGSVRIGSFGLTSSLHILPTILNQFRSQYPDIDVYIEEGPDEEVIQWVQERRVDIGFIVLPDERFITHKLLKDRFVALVPKASDLAHRSSITLKELCERPFIMTEADSAGIIGGLFKSAGLRPKTQFRTSQVLSTLAMVSANEGLAIVAEMALPNAHHTIIDERPHVGDQGLKGYVVKPLEQVKERSIGLALHSDGQASPAAKAFIATALAVTSANR